MRFRRALSTLILPALLLAGCGGSAQRSANVTSGAAPAGAIKIEAGDNVFSPDSVEAVAGEEVTVEVSNRGRIPHDFTIDQVGVSTGVLQPGDVVTAKFTMPGDEVKYVCTLHRGMEGKMTPGAA